MCSVPFCIKQFVLAVDRVSPISRFGPGGGKIVLDPASKLPVSNRNFPLPNTYESAAITLFKLSRRLTVVRVGKQPCARHGFPGACYPRTRPRWSVYEKNTYKSSVFSMDPGEGGDYWPQLRARLP